MIKIFNILFGFFLLISAVNAQVTYYSNTNLKCDERDFSVSVHLVLDSSGNSNISHSAIDDTLAIVNQYFEPLCWTFGRCKIDSIINYSFDTLDIHRYIKLQEHFNDDHMINLYFVAQGYTTDVCHFANQDGMLEPDRASLVMWRSCTTKDLVHKLGHLFGLLDTWNPSNPELVDGSNCTTAGDLLCSTPGDPFVPYSIIPFTDSECNFNVGVQDANGEYYDPEVGNIMSYYDDCRNGFTLEQYEVMRALYESLDYAPW